ncbi:MAG: hypothetical protein HPY75_14630 [Actinobacteria bacterium]|nr:hypothetical protein [Actinomycetota bacterium]
MRESDERDKRSGRDERDRDLMRLVDRYRDALEDIRRMKLRAASLGGSAAALRMGDELARRSEELEEIEREIEELRARIIDKQTEISGLEKEKGGRQGGRR